MEIVNVSANNNVVVEVSETTTIVSGVVGPPGPRGLPGPPGPQGETTLGGLGIDLQNVSAGDLIVFNGVNWVNNAKETVTEGGNF